MESDDGLSRKSERRSSRCKRTDGCAIARLIRVYHRSPVLERDGLRVTLHHSVSVYSLNVVRSVTATARAGAAIGLDADQPASRRADLHDQMCETAPLERSPGERSGGS